MLRKSRRTLSRFRVFSQPFTAPAFFGTVLSFFPRTVLSHRAFVLSSGEEVAKRKISCAIM